MTYGHEGGGWMNEDQKSSVNSKPIKCEHSWTQFSYEREVHKDGRAQLGELVYIRNCVKCGVLEHEEVIKALEEVLRFYADSERYGTIEVISANSDHYIIWRGSDTPWEVAREGLKNKIHYEA